MTQAKPSPEIELRHCHTLEEFEACLELQRAVWGGEDIDVVPLPVFVVAAETGGQVLGAFAGGKLVGFTLAVAGVRDDRRPFLHSHMTAVRENYRDLGIGRRLKLFQRQDALSRGIEWVEWTFDPLELKNAYFNLVRLGAIVRRFLPNCYGITTSPLHGGLPTDRIVAEWWLNSPRVAHILGESAVGAARQAALPLGASGEEKIRIRVPGEIAELRLKDRSAALAMQSRIREQFEHWLGRGYAATAVELAESGGDYLLEPWSQA